jgi:protein-disulfide isomerase
LVGAYLNGRLAASYAGHAVEASLEVPSHAPILGAPTSGVTIVEFFDPACEGCRAFYPVLKSILAAYPDEVRLVLRYAPFHRGSEEAVRILHAAHLQGRFQAVLDALMEQQHEWAAHPAPGLETAWTIAEAAGLDVASARIAAFAEGADRVLARDNADTRSQRIQVTPTFLVNGRRLETLGEHTLRGLVAEEVKRVRGRTAAAAERD